MGTIIGSHVDEINNMNKEASDFFIINEQKICDIMNSNRNQCIIEWENMIRKIKAKIYIDMNDKKKSIYWAKTSGPETIDILIQSLPRIIRYALNVNEEMIPLLLFSTKK